MPCPLGVFPVLKPRFVSAPTPSLVRPYEEGRSAPFFVTVRLGTRGARFSALSRPPDALPAPLTQQRRSNTRGHHPRLHRHELEAARAAAHSRLDQVRHRHRTPTSALRTPARRRPSDRHSPRACRAAAGASARAAAAALNTFTLDDEPEVLLGARSWPEPPARQPADSHTRAFRRGAAAVHAKVARVVRVRVGRPP